MYSLCREVAITVCHIRKIISMKKVGRQEYNKILLDRKLQTREDVNMSRKHYAELTKNHPTGVLNSVNIKHVFMPFVCKRS